MKYESDSIWDIVEVKKHTVECTNSFRDTKGQSKREGQNDLILKLEDWKPSCLSQGEWPWHFAELISCLPFRDYTHPQNGYLNVAVKIPQPSFKPDMGLRMDIGYRDSVTNLQYLFSMEKVTERYRKVKDEHRQLLNATSKVEVYYVLRDETAVQQRLEFHEGDVFSFNPTDKKHKVLYADGDEEVLDQVTVFSYFLLRSRKKEYHG